MSIASAKININGTDYTLTHGTGNTWTATITAPGATSYNQANHKYNCSVTATNTAGTSATVNGSTLSGLLLQVKETVKPTITITSPSTGAYVTNSKQPVVFTVVDEAGGSGTNLSTLIVKQDGTAVAAATLAHTAITNGYSVTYTPASALTDGAHTVTVTVSDYDGNAATAVSTAYTVDTVPPTLTVTSPAAGLTTNSTTLAVAGTTNDSTSSPVSIVVKLNGTSQGAVTVNANGTFSKSVTLAEGSNTIVVTATDAAGKTTEISRTVALDTTAPSITAVTITPNPANTGATLTVSVTIQ